MIRIESNPSVDPVERYDGADFGLRVNDNAAGLMPGDIMSFCTIKDCNTPRGIQTSPIQLKGEIIRKRPNDVYAMLGNAGCEVTFRQVAGKNARKNIKLILEWAKQAFDILGHKLVLAPMDMDLIHDVMYGSKLLEWSAINKVPLCIFCGYRFLFEDDAFEEIAKYSKIFNFDQCGNSYEFPYDEISDAIRGSGAEVWTGAGFHEGLKAGTMQQAAEFGYSGVLTTKAAWLAGLSKEG